MMELLEAVTFKVLSLGLSKVASPETTSSPSGRAKIKRVGKMKSANKAMLARINFLFIIRMLFPFFNKLQQSDFNSFN